MDLVALRQVSDIMRSTHTPPSVKQKQDEKWLQRGRAECNPRSEYTPVRDTRSVQPRHSD